MKKPLSRHVSWTLAAAVIAGGCAPAEEPAPAPTPEPAPPKVTAVAFAVPILEGKSEDWKQFIADVKGDRAEEWNEARAAAGLTREMVWHQASPAGEFAVVYHEGPDLGGVMGRFAASETPIDQDFVAMVSNVHGMDPSQPPPPGKLAIDTGEAGSHPLYGFAVPIVEGKEQVAAEFVAANAGANAEAFAASRERSGIARERVWSHDGGKLFVVVWESEDVGSVMSKWLASEDPFDVAFWASVQEFTGVDYKAGDPPAPNELMFDWKASE